MKQSLLLLCLLAALSISGCKKTDTIDCTIYWQLYNQPKSVTLSDIEGAFQSTFFGYYELVNDNTVRARNTTKNDVRSLSVKLASMADALIDDRHGQSEQTLPIEVRVYIDFNGSYIEEVWSKTYQYTQW